MPKINRSTNEMFDKSWNFCMALEKHYIDEYILIKN